MFLKKLLLRIVRAEFTCTGVNQCKGCPKWYSYYRWLFTVVSVLQKTVILIVYEGVCSGSGWWCIVVITCYDSCKTCYDSLTK